MPIEPLSTILAWVIGVCGIIIFICSTVFIIIFAFGSLIEFFTKDDSKDLDE